MAGERTGWKDSALSMHLPWDLETGLFFFVLGSYAPSATETFVIKGEGVFAETCAWTQDYINLYLTQKDVYYDILNEQFQNKSWK